MKDLGTSSSTLTAPLSSEQAPEQVPWAYIAHKNGYWAGVASAELGRKELRKFLGDFVVDGFAITTVYSRDEYKRLISGLGFWRDSPEYKAKFSHSDDRVPAGNEGGGS